MPVYRDANVMFRDIVGYIRSTGNDLYCDDRPSQSLFGYRSGVVDHQAHWHILARDLTSSGHRYGMLWRTGHREAVTADLLEEASLGTASTSAEAELFTAVDSAFVCVPSELAGGEAGQTRDIFDRLLGEED